MKSDRKILTTNPGSGNIPEEWFDVLRHMEVDFKSYISEWADFRTRLIYSGGWKTGYKWRGKVELVLHPGRGEDIKKIYQCKMKHGVYSYNLEDIQKFYEKNKTIYYLRASAKRLVSLYRLLGQEGIISKKRIKAHQKKLDLLFGNLGRKYENKEVQEKAYKLLMGYLTRFAKCPQCGYKGFHELIQGIGCENNCGYLIDDIDTNNVFAVKNQYSSTNIH